MDSQVRSPVPRSMIAKLTLPRQEPPSSSTNSVPPRTTQKAFDATPEHVEPTPLTVRGPLIQTVESSNSFAQPAASTSPTTRSPPPGPNTSSPPASNTLPSPSQPEEARPAGAEIDSAQVEIVLDDTQIKDAESWHKERLERKMRGEYERMGKQLAEVVSTFCRGQHIATKKS